MLTPGASIFARCFRSSPVSLRSGRLTIWVVLLLGLAAGSARGQTAETELRLVGTTVSGFAPATISVRLDSDVEVTGFTLAVEFDPSLIAAIAVDAAGVAADAEVVLGEIFPDTGGVLLHVEIDNDGSGPTSIGPGDDVLVAEILVTALDPSLVSTPVAFTDGVIGSPAVTNQVALTTGPVDASGGLALVGSSVASAGVATDRIAIPAASIPSGATAELPVLMDNPSGPVEGFALSIAHDVTVLALEAISIDGTVTEAAGAEFVSADTTPSGGDGGVLTVLLDFNTPFDGQTISPGADQPIAYFTYTAVIDLIEGVDPSVQTTLEFVDGVFGSPPVDNLLLFSGAMSPLDPERETGLVTVVPSVPFEESLVHFYVGGSELTLDGLGLPVGPPPITKRGGTTKVCFYYTSEVNLQGFQLALTYDCELKLSNFRVDESIAAAVGAEFVNHQIDSDPFDGDGCELIVGILLDALPPFDGQTVPPTDQPLRIGCVDVLVCDEPICQPQPSSDSGVAFYCGPEDLALDALGNPLGGPLFAEPGETVDVCFFYTSTMDEIQGFQIAVCFDCGLTFGTFSIQDSVVQAAGAEFVNFNVDNDPSDGDGCELLVGILLDSFPPFDGQTVPATSEPLLIGCIDATVSPDAQCEEFLTIEFCDFVDGTGDVPIENIAVIDFGSTQNFPKFCCAIRVGGAEPCTCLEFDYTNFIDGNGEVEIENIAVVDFTSYQAIGFHSGEVCLEREPRFVRGDCNDDEKHDLADAAMILGEQFSGLTPNCLDACDTNDDGSINLADSVFLLNYLLGFSVPPPAPFPLCGPDPSDDALGCESVSACPF